MMILLIQPHTTLFLIYLDIFLKILSWKYCVDRTHQNTYNNMIKSSVYYHLLIVKNTAITTVFLDIIVLTNNIYKYIFDSAITLYIYYNKVE